MQIIPANHLMPTDYLRLVTGALAVGTNRSKKGRHHDQEHWAEPPPTPPEQFHCLCRPAAGWSRLRRHGSGTSERRHQRAGRRRHRQQCRVQEERHHDVRQCLLSQGLQPEPEVRRHRGRPPRRRRQGADRRPLRTEACRGRLRHPGLRRGASGRQRRHAPLRRRSDEARRRHLQRRRLPDLAALCGCASASAPWASAPGAAPP